MKFDDNIIVNEEKDPRTTIEEIENLINENTENMKRTINSKINEFRDQNKILNKYKEKDDTVKDDQNVHKQDDTKEPQQMKIDTEVETDDESNSEEETDDDISITKIKQQKPRLTRELKGLGITETLTDKVRRELKRLETSYNPTTDEQMHIMTEEGLIETMIGDEICLTSTTIDEPKTFDEAWFEPDMTIRKNWREAIKRKYAAC